MNNAIQEYGFNMAESQAHLHALAEHQLELHRNNPDAVARIREARQHIEQTLGTFEKKVFRLGTVLYAGQEIAPGIKPYFFATPAPGHDRCVTTRKLVLFKMTRSNLQNLALHFSDDVNMIRAIAEATDAKARLGVQGIENIVTMPFGQFIGQFIRYDKRAATLMWKRYQESDRLARRVRSALSYARSTRAYKVMLAVVVGAVFMLPNSLTPYVQRYRELLQQNADRLVLYLATLPNSVPSIMQGAYLCTQTFRNRKMYARFQQTMHASCLSNKSSAMLAQEMRNGLHSLGFDGWMFESSAATTTNGTYVPEHIVLWTDRANNPFRV
jgi:hypothetical protein